MSDLASDGRRITAVDRAAGGLLGALLWDPRRITDVAGVLDANDFERWGDRAVYRTLVGMLHDGRFNDLMTLSEESLEERRTQILLEIQASLADRAYHDAYVDPAGRGPLSGYALFDLISQTPRTASSNHKAWARIVLDGSIRRQVAEAGIQITQYARHIGGQRSESAAEILSPVLAKVEARLQGLAGRSTHSAIVAALSPGTPPARVEPAAPAQSPSPSPSRTEVSTRQRREAEYILLGACLVDPGLLNLVADRLQASDFETKEVAATWQAVSSALREHGVVDDIVVGVEVERQGKLPELGYGLAAGQLASWVTRVARGMPTVGYRAVETIVHAALTRAVRETGDQLQKLGHDRAQSRENLLASAQHTIDEAENTIARLTGTTPAQAAAAALRPPPGRIPAARTPPEETAPSRINAPSRRDRGQRRR